MNGCKLLSFRTLIDAEDLRRHRDGPGWCVFDCRCSPFDPAVGRSAYLAGHIPGARHADLDWVLAGPKTATSGRHPLPARAVLAEWLGREGVGGASQVVAYDDAGGAFAARLWWLLRWLGHERVAVLDGGLTAWCEAGGELEAAEAPSVPAAAFTPGEPLGQCLDAAEVLEISRERSPGVLVDARAAPRYRGESEPVDAVAGHIPGALNRPYGGNLDASRRFLDRERLRERFAGLSRNPSLVVHYCGSGVTACHNVLAMEHAGLTGSRLYAGSWSEWIRDPERPVTRGPEGE
ncbi:MAG TPA: sulfurtransferase [Gammaproteobacteria bacterium]|nr:sulfurtransferase [Gammaproteobacteria bacterium]